MSIKIYFMNMISTVFKMETVDFSKAFDDLMDAYEMETYAANNKNFSVDIPLPGLSKNEIELEIVGKSFTIKTKLNEPSGYLKRYQDYRYSYQLTDKYDLVKIVATMKNGLLTINVPLKEQKTESFKIEVK